MGIQQIRIEQQLAQIGVNMSLGQLQIQKPQGQLTIRNSRAQLSINSQLPSFRVNRQQLNREIGLKAPLELTHDFRDEGKQAALQAAGQYKNDGNYLANYRVPAKSRTPNLATNKAMARLGPKQFNIGLMPQSTPDLMWDKGNFDINFSKHSLNIDYNGRNTAQVSLSPRATVEVYLRQRSYINISVTEAVSSPGRYIDSVV